MHITRANQYSYMIIPDYFRSKLPFKSNFVNFNSEDIVKHDIIRDNLIHPFEVDNCKTYFLRNEEMLYFNPMINQLNYENNQQYFSPFSPQCRRGFKTGFSNDLDLDYLNNVEWQTELLMKLESGIGLGINKELENKVIPSSNPISKNFIFDRKHKANSTNFAQKIRNELTKMRTSSSYITNDNDTVDNIFHSINQESKITAIPENKNQISQSSKVIIENKNKNNIDYMLNSPKNISQKKIKQVVISKKSKKISKIEIKKNNVENKKQNAGYHFNIKLTRKVVKNFGKAIASFACSPIAKQFIMKIINNNEMRYFQFLQFIYENKDTIEGNRRLKLLLQPQPEDSFQNKQNKAIFKSIAETFMDRHVYKWIWNSHVENKTLHAKLIDQVRLRIQDPNLLSNLTN